MLRQNKQIFFTSLFAKRILLREIKIYSLQWDVEIAARELRPVAKAMAIAAPEAVTG